MKDEIESILFFYGDDILNSSFIKKEKDYIHHGSVSVFDHSYRVAFFCIFFSLFLPLVFNRRALIRGALLHDYFLYDWHEDDPSHKWHGFIHAKRAYFNASRDFDLCNIEKDIILRHMFPLNITPPKYRESILVCCVDKVCALGETLFLR